MVALVALQKQCSPLGAVSQSNSSEPVPVKQDRHLVKADAAGHVREFLQYEIPRPLRSDRYAGPLPNQTPPVQSWVQADSRAAPIQDHRVSVGLPSPTVHHNV